MNHKIEDILKEDLYKKISFKRKDPFSVELNVRSLYTSISKSENNLFENKDETYYGLNLFFDYLTLGYFLQKVSKDIPSIASNVKIFLIDDKIIEKSDVLNCNISSCDVGQTFSSVYSKRYDTSILVVKGEESSAFTENNFQVTTHLDNKAEMYLLTPAFESRDHFTIVTNIVISSNPNSLIYQKYKKFSDYYSGLFVFFGINSFFVKSNTVSLYHERSNDLNFSSFFNTFYLFLKNILESPRNTYYSNFILNKLYLNLESNENVFILDFFLFVYINRFVERKNLHFDYKDKNPSCLFTRLDSSIYESLKSYELL